jgi:hypothetical protein
MARHAAEVNASFFAANPLFLKPCSRPTYLSFVREHFPHLVADYHHRFDHADFATKPYATRIAQIVEEARRRHGLDRRWRDDRNPQDDRVRNPENAAKPSRKPPSPSHPRSGDQARLFA